MPTGIYQRNSLPEEVRFFKYVKKTHSCWIWTGATSKGYGSFTKAANGGSIKSYRWSYLFHIGVIKDGLHLDHLCRNKLCVNPNHLEPVTPIENVLRGINPAAVNKRKTHCIRGHRFTKENIYKRKSEKGKRCVKCMKIYNSKRYLK